MDKKEEKGIFYKISGWLKGLTIKGLLSLILIVFIVIMILLSLITLPSALNKLTNTFSAALYSIFIPAEKATMMTDRKSINSGDDIKITFKNEGINSTGVFAITYACDPNISLSSVESRGLKKIDCDNPYYLLTNQTIITLRPTTEKQVSNLVITGYFENDDTHKMDTVGLSRIIVKNNTNDYLSDPNLETNNNSTATSTITRVNTQSDKPDLAIRILQVGILNSYTNLISPQNQFQYYDPIGIKFEVRNDGTANTGPWYFTATLPSISTPFYISNQQISLRPGDSIIFTLGFSNLKSQNPGSITIEIDPQNTISDNIRHNNVAVSQITNITNNYIHNYNISCYASPSNPQKGDRVRWYVNIVGGDGNYSYNWIGTDGLNSTSANPSKTYTSRGEKSATVTIQNNNNYISQTCYVYVN